MRDTNGHADLGGPLNLGADPNVLAASATDTPLGRRAAEAPVIVADPGPGFGPAPSAWGACNRAIARAPPRDSALSLSRIVSTCPSARGETCIAHDDAVDGVALGFAPCRNFVFLWVLWDDEEGPNAGIPGHVTGVLRPGRNRHGVSLPHGTKEPGGRGALARRAAPQ